VKGKIRVTDTPESLKEKVKETEVLEIRPQPFSPNLLQLLEGIPDVEKTTFVEDRIRLYGDSVHNSVCQILNRLEAQGIKISSIQTMVPTLEDAFVKMTGVDVEAMRADKPMKMGGMG
jgi:ABC-2 type transport system ATP-binding protein